MQGLPQSRPAGSLATRDRITIGGVRRATLTGVQGRLAEESQHIGAVGQRLLDIARGRLTSLIGLRVEHDPGFLAHRLDPVLDLFQCGVQGLVKFAEFGGITARRRTLRLPAAISSSARRIASNGLPSFLIR